MTLTKDQLRGITRTVGGYQVRNLELIYAGVEKRGDKPQVTRIIGELKTTNGSGLYQRASWLPNGRHQLRPALHLDTSQL